MERTVTVVSSCYDQDLTRGPALRIPIIGALVCLGLVLGLVLVACGFVVRGSSDEPLAASSSSSGGAADGGPSPGQGDGAVVIKPPGAPVIPSHVDAGADPDAPDLSGLSTIDTAVPSLTYVTSGPKIDFIIEAGIAILKVGSWKVDVPLRVRGTRPLIVIAARAVEIDQRVDVAAHLGEPGAGGSRRMEGPGRGLPGFDAPSTSSTGGGGAGAATAGARGGSLAEPGMDGGPGGPAVGGALDDFFGGSGGGNGSPYGSCGEGGGGGAGGGALQITSLISITMRGPNGAINAGGGGGRGGCLYNAGYAMSGGGGGAGGVILLEAPAVTIQGGAKLASNGGGGGGGGFASGPTAGVDGEDARLATTAADGGLGAEGLRNGGSGGAGSTPPMRGMDNSTNQGGGGGSVGFIWIRTRGGTLDQIVLPSAVVSPAPKTDPTL